MYIRAVLYLCGTIESMSAAVLASSYKAMEDAEVPETVKSGILHQSGMLPPPPNYPLRHLKYHLIETIRPLI